MSRHFLSPLRRILIHILTVDDFFTRCLFLSLGRLEESVGESEWGTLTLSLSLSLLTARNHGRWRIHVETIASQLPMSNNTFSTDSKETGLPHRPIAYRLFADPSRQLPNVYFSRFDSTLFFFFVRFTSNILLEAVVIVEMRKYCFGPTTMNDDVVAKGNEIVYFPFSKRKKRTMWQG